MATHKTITACVVALPGAAASLPPQTRRAGRLPSGVSSLSVHRQVKRAIASEQARKAKATATPEQGSRSRELTELIHREAACLLDIGALERCLQVARDRLIGVRVMISALEARP